MSVRLNQRDQRLLTKLVAARWLTTRQIRSLFFPNATLDATRKRLRKLAYEHYLRAYQPHQMAETIHTLGLKGRLVMEGKGLEVDLERGEPKQIRHYEGINAIRLSVETSGVPVVFFFAAWELARLGWTWPVIPDAVFSIKQGKNLTYAVEFDRGSEPIKKFARKIGLYQGIQGVQLKAVLVVTETVGRIRILARYLPKFCSPPLRCLATTLVEVQNKGIFSEIFLDLLDAGSNHRKYASPDKDSTSLVQVSRRKERFL